MEATKRFGTGIFDVTKGVCKGTYNITRDAVVYTGGAVYKGGKKLGDATFGSSTSKVDAYGSSPGRSSSMGSKLGRAASGTYQVGAAGVSAIGKPIVKGGKSMVGFVAPSMKSKMNKGYIPMDNGQQWKTYNNYSV